MTTVTLLAAWQGDDDELVTLRHENGGWTLEGRLSGPDVAVVVRLDEAWCIRQLLLFRDLDEPDLWLATDGNGTWGEMNGSVRDELHGVVVAGVAGSALVHALAVRAGGGELDVAVVDPETLEVRVERRGYLAVGDRRWRCGGDEWAVDHLGLPRDLPGRARAV